MKIEIEDQGTGIPEEHLQKIFDPYFTTKEKGSGLGLATCYSIAKKHDGLITVASKLGKGTTFYIYIPASHVTEEHKESIIDATPLTGKGKVLLMDDDEMIRNVANAMLSHIGYEVVFAKNGSEAITLYKSAMEQNSPFVVVIMDLTIPGGMGGAEAVQQLLAIDSKLKAIVSSGYAHDPIMAEYQNRGFKGVIVKPYKIEELSRVLQEVIEAG